MAWYRAGTVSVTNGSATVTGAGTDFVSNASIGEAFLGPDGRAYEIAQVVSATQIVLGMPYQGAGAGGQGYAILPTQSFARDLARGAAELLNTFAEVRDGVGQGLFPDGTVAAPGMRFRADQDTGFARLSADRIGVVAGGAVRFEISSDSETRFRSSYLVSEGAAAKAPVGLIGRIGGANTWLLGSDALVKGSAATDDGLSLYSYGSAPLRFYTSNVERGRFDADGNLLLGVTGGTEHTISKAGGLGSAVLRVFGAGGPAKTSGVFASVDSYGPNGAGAALYLGRNTTTGRSANSEGTLNASGADYAEYMVKAAGCGIIAKGDVCGVDRDGRLTKTWADAISFVIKSTDPSLVGGDTWDAEVGPKPEQPSAEPVEPTPLAPPAEDADDVTIAAWREAMAAYPAQVASYQAARVEWQKATDAYAKDLPVWEAAHEKARQCVDRIAFCGQVPANVSGDFEVGDYIIAAASGAGIKAVAVKADDMTLPQYMRRIGKVWAVREGRAWIDVQHG